MREVRAGPELPGAAGLGPRADDGGRPVGFVGDAVGDRVGATVFVGPTVAVGERASVAIADGREHITTSNARGNSASRRIVRIDGA